MASAETELVERKLLLLTFVNVNTVTGSPVVIHLYMTINPKKKKQWRFNGTTKRFINGSGKKL